MLQKLGIAFLLLLSFKEIITDCPASPASRNDCFTSSNSTHYCCYKNSACEPIPKNQLSNDADCGITNDNYGKYEFGQYHPKQALVLEGFQGCGVYEPKKKDDCIEYSELSNSCCFFQKNGKNACFSIGKKFDGKSSKFNFDGYTVECNSFNLILSIYSLLLLIFIF